MTFPVLSELVTGLPALKHVRHPSGLRCRLSLFVQLRASDCDWNARLAWLLSAISVFNMPIRMQSVITRRL